MPDDETEDGEPQQAPAATPASSAPAAGAAAPLPEVSLEYWASLDEDSRIHCYDQLRDFFDSQLEEFRISANQAVEEYRGFSRLAQDWRLVLVVLTSFLALLNVLASGWPEKLGDGPAVRAGLSFAAAIYAVLLALVTNLDSFLNYSEKKQTARESRELFLDAYREFEMLRLTYVYPFGYTPQGCVNFHELYRRLVAKDVELRRKHKQLSATGARGAETGGAR